MQATGLTFYIQLPPSGLSTIRGGWVLWRHVGRKFCRIYRRSVQLRAFTFQLGFESLKEHTLIKKEKVDYPFYLLSLVKNR